MTDPGATRPTAALDSPGAMLRAAREKQGLHIAALAAAIKVAPRKLDALENDRWQDLPDATFARALAQTVCRTLKVDARPILDRLPRADAASLEHVGGSLNMPFDDVGPRSDGLFAGVSLRPMVLASAVLMLAALVLYVAPIPWGRDDVLTAPQPVVLAPPLPASEAQTGDVGADTANLAAGDAAPGADTGVAPAAAETGVVGVAGAGPAPAGTTPTAATAALPPPSPTVPAVPATTPTTPTPGATSGILRVRTSADSWIEVRDADDRLLLSRVVSPGEALGLDGTPPLRLVVGNAQATELQFRGQPLDLAPLARNNIVRTTLR